MQFTLSQTPQSGARFPTPAFGLRNGKIVDRLKPLRAGQGFRLGIGAAVGGVVKRLKPLRAGQGFRRGNYETNRKVLD